MTTRTIHEMKKTDYQEALRIASGYGPSRWNNSAPAKETPLEQLTPHAVRAGMFSAEDLSLADLSGLKVDSTGRVQNGAEFVYRFRDEKPHLFAPLKNAKDMSASEFRQAVGKARST